MNSKNTTRLLTAVLVLQGLTLMGQWFSPSYTSTASAQIPDSGALRIQTVDELKSVNAKLDKLISILESGKLQVRATSDDAKK
jgi:hypothetical protein